VLSGRGLCDELITRPEESYRLCCVVVCDLETSIIGAPYIYNVRLLRVKANWPRKTGVNGRSVKVDTHFQVLRGGILPLLHTSSAHGDQSQTQNQTFTFLHKYSMRQHRPQTLVTGTHKTEIKLRKFAVVFEPLWNSEPPRGRATHTTVTTNPRSIQTSIHRY